ncbi:MAG: sigma-70 family RNA polymerase sigma factor [Planctomycetota bacterium]
MREPAQADPERPEPFEARDEVTEDLLLAFQLGERAAFDAIVLRFQAPLVRFFYRLCWDRDRAEDFTQDVFLKVLRAAKSYRPQGKLSTFLFRIATNRWIDYYRSLQPRPRLRSLDQTHEEEDRPLADSVPSGLPGPPDLVEEDQEKARLRRAIHRLTLPHRLVFELAVYQNLPYAEISALLDIPEGTVKSRMHNATKAVRKLLEEEEEQQEARAQRAGFRRRGRRHA